MSQKHNLPERPTFGDDFNYSRWTPNTQVTLTSVPWNGDYRDIVRFSGQAGLNAYIDGKQHDTFTEMSYHKVNQPVRLSVPFNTAFKYNYLRAYNPAQPINGDMPRYFYYFITDIVYINPGTTEFLIQLDVWQTFGYGIRFGNCYVERGHIGIANEKQNMNYGREYLTVPEGLDLGGEYEIAGLWSQDLGSARNRENGFSVIVTSTIALDADPGDINDPKFTTGRGSSFEHLPNGAEAYLFPSPGRLQEFLRAFADKPWVTQGIISIQAIPVYLRYEIPVESVTIGGVNFFKIGNGTPVTKKVSAAGTWRNNAKSHLGRYRNLDKFLTFPYSFLELTSYNGTPLVIKPESWSSANGEVVEVVHFAQPSPRIVFYPYRYNAALTESGTDLVPAETDKTGVVNDAGEFLDMATGIINMPTFSLVNNSYIGFMASNVHSIAYQHQSADWSQQKAYMGAETSFAQSNAAMNLSNDLSQQGIGAAQRQSDITNQTTALQGMQGAITGALGAAGQGNPLGAAGAIASNAASSAIAINANHHSMLNSTGLARGTNASQVNNMAYNRDTNWAYADAAAQGDYSNTIAGINAKVQDAKLMQPSVSGQVGGEAFNLAQYKWGYDIKLKMIQGAARRIIGEFWLRYGYAVSRFTRMPADFMVMEKFTFWKLKETYITASACPEAYKQAIRGIFENGVTVWRNPEDIGNIDIADNAPLKGVQL